MVNFLSFSTYMQWCITYFCMKACFCIQYLFIFINICLHLILVGFVPCDISIADIIFSNLFLNVDGFLSITNKFSFSIISSGNLLVRIARNWFLSVFSPRDPKFLRQQLLFAVSLIKNRYRQLIVAVSVSNQALPRLPAQGLADNQGVTIACRT